MSFDYAQGPPFDYEGRKLQEFGMGFVLWGVWYVGIQSLCNLQELSYIPFCPKHPTIPFF